MTRLGTLSVLIGVVTGCPASAMAGTCALCRQALASSGNPGLIQGFYWSILLIAGVPLGIMAGVGWVVWQQRRVKRLANRAAP